jgi:hypothetical protein
MRLVSFTVQNYRSITKAHRIEVSKSTVLVGPNNEGKSNVLRALITAMQVLTTGARPVFLSSRPSQLKPAFMRFAAPRHVYDWVKDFPIHLQKTQPDGVSVFGLDFELEAGEIADFRRTIKSDLDGWLPLRLELGNGVAKVSVRKKGPGGAALSQKSVAIGRFVANHIEFEYIPAIRTAKSSQRVIDSLVQRELRTVEEQPDYKAAVAKIGQLQQPVLDKLSRSIRGTMVSFLPAIKDVKFLIEHEER